MKRSRSVNLGLLAAAAGGVLSGCSAPVVAPPIEPKQIQQCVDAQGQVLPESECEKRGSAANATGGHFGGGPFWIYHMGMPFRVGQTIPNAGLYTSPHARRWKYARQRCPECGREHSRKDRDCTRRFWQLGHGPRRLLVSEGHHR